MPGFARSAAAVPLFCAALLAAHGVFAMHVRATIEIAAWSDEGDSVLLHVLESGPEGGGSEQYRLLTLQPLHDATFTLSADFSDGSQRHESVTKQARAQALQNLYTELRAKNFSGAQLTDGQLSLPALKPGFPLLADPMRPDSITASRARIFRLAHGPLQLIREKERFRLEANGKAISTLSCKHHSDNQQGDFETQATFSPSGWMLLVIETSATLGIDRLCGLMRGSSDLLFDRPRAILSAKASTAQVGGAIELELVLENASDVEQRLSMGFGPTSANHDPVFELTLADGQRLSSYGEQALPVKVFLNYDRLIVAAHQHVSLGRFDLSQMTFIDPKKASGNPKGYRPLWELLKPGRVSVRWWDGVYQLREPLFSNSVEIVVEK